MKRSFLILLLVAGGLVIVLLLGRANSTTSTTAGSAAATGTMAATATPEPTLAVTGAAAAAGTADSQAFIVGWLNYIYGRGSLAAIPAVSDYVRTELGPTRGWVDDLTRAAGGYTIVDVQRTLEGGGVLKVDLYVASAVKNSEVHFTFLMGLHGSRWTVLSIPKRAS